MHDLPESVLSESLELAKLRASLAWLKTCPVWQKADAAEAALGKALGILVILDARLDALERGGNGNSQD
jgi:hypothetical protein